MNYRIEEKNIKEKLSDIKVRIKRPKIGLGIPKGVQRYLKRTSTIHKRYKLSGSRITRRLKQKKNKSKLFHTRHTVVKL